MIRFKTTHFRILGMVVLMAGLTMISCNDSTTSAIGEKEMEHVTHDVSDLMSNAQISNKVVIDDFNGPTGSWAQWWPSLYVYQADASVLGGARELRSYRSALTRIDGDAGTLEWGGISVSPEYGVRYGSAIGANFHSTKGANPNDGMGTELNLNVGLDGEIILQVLNVSPSNPNIGILLHSSSGWWYSTGVTLTEGEVRVPLSSFTVYQSTTPMPEEAAADIDGIILDGFAHLDEGTPGTGTVFAQIAIGPGGPGDPASMEECKKGGWADFGFRNQGQCIRFVNTGQDSR